MSKASTIQHVITISGDGVNLRFAPPAYANAASPGGPVEIVLAMGNNTVVVPTGAAGFTFVGTALGTYVLKGINGDTGISVDGTNPSSLAFPGGIGPANFVISAPAAGAVFLMWH